jgi:catechol 2,3-dioxygenase-like lactoylglutathione lyase family enzyme
MKLDGFGIFVKEMPIMIRFYRDVLGFAIQEEENTSNVYLEKDGTLFLFYGRDDFEKVQICTGDLKMKLKSLYNNRCPGKGHLETSTG